MRTVLMVLFDQVQSLDVTGPLEVFTGANTWRGGRGAGSAYDIRTASLGGRPVRTSSGLRITPDEDLREIRLPRPGLLIVPGGQGSRRPDPELTAWLRAHGRQADRLVSVCTGAFLLAEAGLLDGRRVTTHWAYCGSLAARYPRVSVEGEPIFVRDGNVATSAGVTAGIDLALKLASIVASRTVAEAIELALEYDPAPPFKAGHPRIASPRIVDLVRARFADRIERRTRQADRVASSRP